MREKLVETIIGFVVVIVVFILPYSIVGTAESHYKLDGTVVMVDNSRVLVCDTTDNLWVFEDDGYREGDKVRMIMFNHHTENDIEDDEIVRVKIVK